MWARGLVGQSVPEPEPTGPATWSTFEHWDGDEDASVSSWVGQTAGIKFVQATSGDQPTYDAADSNWNGKGAFTHGADDHFEVDTGDLALSAQSFWHDGTTSYSLAMPFISDETTLQRTLIGTNTGTTTDVGFNVFNRSSAGNRWVRFTVYNVGASLGFVTTATDSVVPGQKHLLFIRYNHSTNQIWIAIDDGAWSSPTTLSGTPSSGNPTGTLTIMAGTGGATGLTGENPALWIGKYAIDDTRRAEIIAYYNTKYNLGL